jgi:hypothetical protein
MGFSLRRCARLTATLGTGVLTVWIVAALGSLGQTDFRNSDVAMLLENGGETPLSPDSDAPDPAHVVVDANTATPVAANKITEEAGDAEAAATALPLLSQVLPSERPNVQIAALTPPDQVHHNVSEEPNDIKAADECLVSELCIDQYLWSLYQRARKVDTIKVVEQKKASVVKKGKLRTIIQNIVKLVREDFTWKDPAAAERAGMPEMEYVIGGMDRGFKLRLYRAFRAMDEAGLAPGITSGFRDDYRQSLASGLKAATNRSYHGGSLRGGYGHGLAVDIVSANGESDAERWDANERLWNWIDAHGKDFGIGRPYLDKDPPHVAPIDGQEYAAHRRGGKQYADHRRGSNTKQARQ